MTILNLVIAYQNKLQLHANKYLFRKAVLLKKGFYKILLKLKLHAYYAITDCLCIFPPAVCRVTKALLRADNWVRTLRESHGCCGLNPNSRERRS